MGACEQITLVYSLLIISNWSNFSGWCIWLTKVLPGPLTMVVLVLQSASHMHHKSLAEIPTSSLQPHEFLIGSVARRACAQPINSRISYPSRPKMLFLNYSSQSITPRAYLMNIAPLFYSPALSKNMLFFVRFGRLSHRMIANQNGGTMFLNFKRKFSTDFEPVALERSTSRDTISESLHNHHRYRLLCLSSLLLHFTSSISLTSLSSCSLPQKSIFFLHEAEEEHQV